MVLTSDEYWESGDYTKFFMKPEPMTKSHQEIAREAWAHIKGYYAILCNESEEYGGEAIVFDAIEKSYYQGANDMDKNYRERDKLDEASRPQEWTPEYIFELGHNDAGYQTICDAHNAELVYEREKKIAASTLGVTEQKLANENDRLRQQLLQTQEALAVYKKAMDGLYNHNEAVRRAVVEHMGTLNQ